ncbi:MAG: hypothetical protein AVDCRST_MAG56-4245 [uncultured Cytophagales bacterium]|uniref:Uncharacterized protein n=1 Tax=uncultured Cytophagales bacterium TaxID=158755 RepID=A0A6J4JTU0_9SPHI|nr:MAG: hypothetical protein AVDCRST_MAG56-4245 [uncultured Cytophagales bacterium]
MQFEAGQNEVGQRGSSGSTRSRAGLGEAAGKEKEKKQAVDLED